MGRTLVWVVSLGVNHFVEKRDLFDYVNGPMGVHILEDQKVPSIEAQNNEVDRVAQSVDNIQLLSLATHKQHTRVMNRIAVMVGTEVMHEFEPWVLSDEGGCIYCHPLNI